jgi:imidazolonepropionase-like amidohydrolase
MALLKGEAVLNIHCYTVVDLEAAMRITEEFNVSISSFHHALEAWKIPDMLKKRDIVAALFAAHFGFKMEGMQASVHAPRLCDEAGVKVALKTDHPVINGRDLLYQAQKAAHYDLSPQV